METRDESYPPLGQQLMSRGGGVKGAHSHHFFLSKHFEKTEL